MKVQTIDSSGNDVVIEDFPDRRYAEIHDGIRSLAPRIGLSVRDAEPIGFLTGQLSYLETEVMAAEYEERKYQKFLGPCITSEAGEWAETVLYRIKDRTGKGRRISPKSKVMPMADVALAQNAIPVAHGGIGYAYFLQELRASAHTGMPLPAGRMEAAVEGYLDHLDDVALYGEAESNFKGFLNNSGVDSNARNSGAVWDAATAATILNDINVLLGNVYTKSKTTAPPSHLILAPTRYALLVKPRSDNSDYTVLKYVKENNIFTQETGQQLTIMPGPSRMETLGTGQSKMMMAYTPKKGNIKFHIPMPQRFLAPQAEGLEMVVYSEYRYGGLDFSKVYTAEYAYGL